MLTSNNNTSAAQARSDKSSPSLEEIKGDWLDQLLADPELKFGYLKLANALCKHMNRKRGGLAFPGMAKLGSEARISRSSTIRGMKWFEERGHLTVKRQRVGNKNLVNHYWPVLKDGRGSV